MNALSAEKGSLFSRRWRWCNVWGAIRRGLFSLRVWVRMWTPEGRHYRIDRRDPEPGAIELAATRADAERLDELGRIRIDQGELDQVQVRAQDLAASVAQGSLDIPGMSDGRVALHGYPADYEIGLPRFRLFMASLSVERLLLQAYRETGQPQWLALALQRTVQLAAHERRVLNEASFLWNDHAIASRVSVLIQLWSVVRTQPALRSAYGVALIAFAQRSGRMLAKPGLFTVRTNHGVMQNIALLQLAAAFPDLPEAAAWRETAAERLRLQRPFYISAEGVVLEHSAGYQAMGAALLAYAHRLLHLNGLPDDPGLTNDIAASRHVLEQLLRPDGSLPALGDTDAGLRHGVTWVPADASAPPRTAAPPPTSAPAMSGLFPASGWAVWWFGNDKPRTNQLMVTWAKHDGHAHKHADEGAIFFWSKGTEWLTAVGYWPYGAPLEAQSCGWNAANAAHELGETASSPRQADLLLSAETQGSRYVDIVRRVEGGATFRRQVLQLDADSFLVLDFATGAAPGTETIWTFGPNIQLLARIRADTFTTAPDAQGRRLHLALAANSPLAVEHLRGSSEPFGGWTTLRRQPAAVDALRVLNRVPASVTAALFNVGDQSATNAILTPLAAGITAEQWRLSLAIGRQRVEVTRLDGEIRIQRMGAPVRTLCLVPPPAGTGAQRRALRAAYEQAVGRFPPWRERKSYLVALSKKLLALLLLLESARFVKLRVARVFGGRHVT